VLTRRCAVLGSPIAHSLSPVLHRAAYAHLGLDWEYDAREVREDELADFLADLDETWAGLSLTMPLKRAVVPLLDEMSERAAQAQAANTVVFEGAGEQRRLVGRNTDIPGAAAALRERHDGPVERAVVLGGGATAASVLLALADLGCRKAVLLVRDPARAADTVEAVGRHAAPPALEVAVLGSAVPPGDVLVSTVPASAQTGLTDLVAEARVVFDVVYDPWPTPLALAAADRFVPVVSGHDLLVHQAVLQVELMTGRSVPVSVLRHALGAAA
jgi:shikimate dehydrogenase